MAVPAGRAGAGMAKVDGGCFELGDSRSRSPETLGIQGCRNCRSPRCCPATHRKAVAQGDGWPRRRATSGSPASTGAETPPARVRRFRRGAAPTPRRMAARSLGGAIDGEFDGTGVEGGPRGVLGRKCIALGDMRCPGRSATRRHEGAGARRGGPRPQALPQVHANRRSAVETGKPAARRSPQEDSAGIPVYQWTSISTRGERLGAGVFFLHTVTHHSLRREKAQSIHRATQ